MLFADPQMGSCSGLCFISHLCVFIFVFVGVCDLSFKANPLFDVFEWHLSLIYRFY